MSSSKELCLIIPGCGDRLLPGVMRRQNLAAAFLPNTRRKIRLSKLDREEVIREYRPIIAFAISHKGGGGDDGSGPRKKDNYNDEVFRRAPRLSGPFLRHPGALFLFHEPFEAMVDSNAPDKFRVLTFPVLDKIHSFSDEYQIPSSRIIYMVNEGGDAHKKPYDLYYKEHPDLEPVRFISYPSLEARTAEHFYHNSSTGEREFVSPCNNRTRKFTYLNNAPRGPRIELCAELWGRGLLDSDWHWSSLQSYYGFMKHYPDFYKAMPKILDVETFVAGKTVRRLTPGDHGESYRFFNDSYISLVSETTTGWKKNQMDGTATHVFLTEKTFKCFFFQHPFIIWGYPRTLREIRRLGYQTFSPWINEDYDEIEDYDERMAAIIEEVQRLKAMTLPQLQKMRQEMRYILDYNSEHFKLPNIQARNLHYFQREINKAVY